MENFDYVYACRQMAKSVSSTVRVYEGSTKLCSFTAWELFPDPIAPYLAEVLNPDAEYGIITTPLFQLYSFFEVFGRYRFVIGPSGLVNNDEHNISQLLLELAIPKEEQRNYTRLLRCPPTLTLEKNIHLIKLLVYMIDRTKPDSEAFFMNKKSTEQYSQVENENMEASVKFADADELHADVEKAYSFEMMMWDLVRAGQVEKLEEIRLSLPPVKAGEMARDGLRQTRNECICSAAMASRAAIEGGLDCATAFQLSDLFIQKVELLHDFHSIRRLQWDMIVDYTERVRLARHGVENSSEVFAKCAKYVQRNIAQHLTVEDMAKALNVSRTHLCTTFKKEANVTLTQFILNEKVLEAKRLMKHTKHSLLEISDYLAFSSQSHFQTVFKKITGQTPADYRNTREK